MRTLPALRPRHKGALLTVPGLLLLAACGSQEPEAPQPRVVQTMVATTVPGGGLKRFTGELRSVDRAALAFELAGIVEEINVELGDPFEAGDRLASLDGAQVQAAVEAAESALGEARTDLQNAEADGDRFLSLRGTGAVAESRIDQAVARRDTARDTFRRQRAELERARDRLEDTVLIAPFDGRVSERLVEPSDVVSAGQPVLRVTGSASKAEAVVAIPERDLSLAGVDTAVTVRLTADGRELPGRVAEVASSAGNAGLVDIVIAVEGENLTPGTRIEVALPDNSLTAGILLPVGSFATGPGDRATVFVVEGDVVRARSVEIDGLTDEGLIAVSGITVGEVIAAKGASRLRDGETITPVGEDLARYDG